MTILLTLTVFLTTNAWWQNSVIFQDHNDAQLKATKKSPCWELAPDQEQLLQNAAKNGYITRRVDFWGNQKNRDIIFRRTIWLNEGDAFRYDYLQNSLKSWWSTRLELIGQVRSPSTKAL